MLVSFCAATHVGCLRTENQDALVLDGWIGHAPRLVREGGAFAHTGASWAAAVVDGMGGYAGGATAALLVADCLAVSLGARSPGDESQSWAAAYRQASDHVSDVASAAPKLSRMGATVAALVVDDTSMAVTNVGDVRAYRWWRGYFTQLSEDDRLPGSSQVTQALGAPLRGMPEPHLLQVPVTDPMRVLLCSDGLWDVAEPEALRQIVGAGSDPTETAHALIDAAIRSGGQDNISVVVVDLFPESGVADPPPAQSGSRIGRTLP